MDIMIEIDGVKYMSEPEKRMCDGCEFKKKSDMCATSNEMHNCADNGVIWIKSQIAKDLKNHTHSPVVPNKYKRKISGMHVHVDVRSSIATIEIDIYDVLKAWNVTNPATQHAIKKLLQPGERGHKDKLTDLREAGKSIDRAIELES